MWTAITGDYLVAPSPAADLPVDGRGPPTPAHAAELRWRLHRTNEATFAPIEGVDPTDLAQSGWALVVPEGIDAAILEALDPLLAAPPQPGRGQPTSVGAA